MRKLCGSRKSTKLGIAKKPTVCFNFRFRRTIEQKQHMEAHSHKYDNKTMCFIFFVNIEAPVSQPSESIKASKIKNKAMFQKIKDIYQEPGSGLSMRFPSN